SAPHRPSSSSVIPVIPSPSRRPCTTLQSRPPKDDVSGGVPLVGHVVLQAKHVNTPDKSCSDSDFARLIKKEHPKIKRLIKEGICDHYIVFTNRKCTGGADEKLTKELRALGLKSAHILGTEYMHKLLEQQVPLQRHLPTRQDVSPFRFDPSELIEVIHAFHEYTNTGSEAAFSSAYDFESIKIKDKNAINGLTAGYFEQVIKADSIPHFPKIWDFLANPRNRMFADLYADAAGELKEKILLYRSRFPSFDHVFGFLYEEIQAQRESLRGRRRLVSVLLHYMYFHCDIGSKSTEVAPEVADADA
ncbi:ABC-three component system protein, partial [Roseomonas sp. AR75]|uniref:ABC-three component system protein n=1 Tax=Roseomonas sp. AR75 TaxID=2562311 RepID=UPI00197D1B16